MDLATATPREIDEHAAELDMSMRSEEGALRSAFSTAHYMLGERPKTTRGGKITGWPTGNDDVAARLRNALLVSHEEHRRERTLAAITSALHTIRELAVLINEVDAEYQARGGWTRFLVVDGGHVHSSRRCAGGTIRATTLVGWNPELSGKTEAEAVAQLGPNLCTHCFPSAPIAWTCGVEKPVDPSVCTNKIAVSGSIHWRVSPWGQCATCGARGVSVSKLGNLRKHKRPTEAV